MRIENKLLSFNIIINFLVSMIKIGGGIFFQTFTLVIDGIYTIGDLITDILAIVGIKYGKKRANKRYPYGYGRIFYIILLFMGIIGLFIGITVIYFSFTIHYQKPALEIIFLIFMAIILKLYSAKKLFIVGKRKKSELLLASSLESKSEAYSTLGLIIIIILSQFIPKVDMIGGILIAILLIFKSLQLISHNISLLIGNSFDDEKIKEKIKKYVDKYKVIHITNLELIQDGPYFQVIITLQAKKDIKVRSLLRIQNRIKKELKATTLGLKFIEFRIT